jgi:hypothetical protein
MHGTRGVGSMHSISSMCSACMLWSMGGI